MKEYVKEMVVDENRIHVLTRYSGKKGKRKKKVSDHNTLFCKFSILLEVVPMTVRKEFFQLKNIENQELFYEETNTTNKLTASFQENRTFPHNANIFFKVLNDCIHKCFKKVRVKSGGNKFKLGDSILQEKLKIKTESKILVTNNNCPIKEVAIQTKLDEIESFLTETSSAKNAERIRTHLGEMENLDGNFCQISVWKLKKKICPKSHDPPMAPKDDQGMLVTAPNLLKKLYLETYQKRVETQRNEVWSKRHPISKRRIVVIKAGRTKIEENPFLENNRGERCS